MSPGLASLTLLLLVLALLLLPVHRVTQVALVVDETTLRVRLGPWDRLYCVSRDLTLPREHIESVAVVPRHLVPTRGMRLPGTAVPGLIRAGSYGTGSRRDFWNVRRAQTLIVIQLRPGSAYRRVILEVADPTAVALELRPVFGAHAVSYN